MIIPMKVTWYYVDEKDISKYRIGSNGCFYISLYLAAGDSQTYIVGEACRLGMSVVDKIKETTEGA